MRKNLKLVINSLFILALVFVLVGCSFGVPQPPLNSGKDNPSEEHKHKACDICGLCLADDCDGTNEERCFGHNEQPETSIKDQFDCISIEEALELAKNAGEVGTAEKYYVYGTIKQVSNGVYGEMTITDGEHDLYVYGVYSADGQTRYDAMEEKPVTGDEVVLLGMLKTFKDKQEMDRGYLQAYTHNKPEINEDEYKEVTAAEAREANAGDKLIVTGVVARITYANGYVPNGFYLVDNTNSIYVYGNDTAGQVKIGNTVTVAAEKTYYVLADEQNNADKFGYKGCCQLYNGKILENDLGDSEFDKSWIQETTVKDIVDADVKENNTTTIYKVNALVKKQIGTGFVNYYFDDLDGVTGSYTYTMCSGGDFEWLDEFDGKICTVYLSPINYKSTASGCVVRFIPIAVSYDGYEFDQTKGAEFALKYYANEQFLAAYDADPELSVLSTVSNDLINLKDVELSYSSNDENVCYFEKTENGVVFHTKNPGKAIITITATYNGITATSNVEVECNAPVDYETITVAEATATTDGEEVIVRGIVASSLVNQTGFYLIDDTGVIAVVGNKEDVALLSAGDEVVVKGIKSHKVKDGYTGAGQIYIYNAEILVNYYGNHEYSTSTFDSTKTINDLYEYNYMEDHSNEVYVVKAIVKVISTPYSTNIKLASLDGSVEFTLYCSNAATQYAFLTPFADQEVTVELALCNWNSKTYYAGCVISVITENGKIINTLNFNE